jgi:uncharacterized protein (TIGR02444 family)
MTEGSPFWKFSLATYARPGVSEACLELQETAGVDVNVLLFLLWLATNRRRVDAQDVSAIVKLVEPWRRDVVGPLRLARRASKDCPPGFDAGAVASLRLAVKRAELEAERLQQEALFAWRPIDQIGALGERDTAAPSNLDLYAQALGADLSAVARERIVAAALSWFLQGEAT